jgi:methylmalonyl-CoA carboxyltransferase small subunit
MRLEIAIDEKRYQVEVEVLEEDSAAAARPRSGAPPVPGATPPPKPQAAAPPVSGDESKLCRSPIAGVVVRVPAEVGKPVKANEPLVVLEAMKMESSITAPRDGTPARVHVKAGDAVQSGQVLVELE